jgi:hypothetical protein
MAMQFIATITTDSGDPYLDAYDLLNDLSLELDALIGSDIDPAGLHLHLDGDHGDLVFREAPSPPDLLQVCKELLAAMVQYELDVNDELTRPPYKHTQMMERARAAINKAERVIL